MDYVEELTELSRVRIQ